MLLHDAKDRSCYRGLLLSLTSDAFILNTGEMRDTLQKLSELSLELQKQTLTVNEAHRAILCQVKVFEGIADNYGTYLSIASQPIKEYCKRWWDPRNPCTKKKLEMAKPPVPMKQYLLNKGIVGESLSLWLLQSPILHHQPAAEETPARRPRRRLR